MSDVSKFHSVDRSQEAEFFIRFCDGANRLPTVQACKREMLRLMQLAPGMRVLDAGCGTGDDARQIAQMAASVTGLDVSEALIEEARRRSYAGDGTEFHVCDLCAMPSEFGGFDVVRCERALMHVPDPAAAVREFYRVLKPGGRAVIFDFEWDALILGGIPRELARRVTRACADSIRNSHIGSDLQGICRDAGFTGVEIWPVSLEAQGEMADRLLLGMLSKAVAAGFFRAQELEEFQMEMEAARRRGTLLVVSPGIITAATTAATR